MATFRMPLRLWMVYCRVSSSSVSAAAAEKERGVAAEDPNEERVFRCGSYMDVWTCAARVDNAGVALPFQNENEATLLFPACVPLPLFAATAPRR